MEEFELTVLDSCSASFEEELEDDTLLSCQAMYAFLALSLFSLFLIYAFSLFSLLGQSALMCPCSQRLKHVCLLVLKSFDFLLLYLLEE